LPFPTIFGRIWTRLLFFFSPILSILLLRGRFPEDNFYFFFPPPPLHPPPPSLFMRVNSPNVSRKVILLSPFIPSALWSDLRMSFWPPEPELEISRVPLGSWDRVLVLFSPSQRLLLSALKSFETFFFVDSGFFRLLPLLNGNFDFSTPLPFCLSLDDSWSYMDFPPWLLFPLLPLVFFPPSPPFASFLQKECPFCKEIVFLLRIFPFQQRFFPSMKDP